VRREDYADAKREARGVADEVGFEANVATAVLVLMGLVILIPLCTDALELLDSMQAGTYEELLQRVPNIPAALSL
jgi:hypothetical protein